jgi:hypothetical protein
MCGYDFLHESGLQEFQFSTSHFFQRDFSEMADRLPRVLLNRRLCSCFGTLVSSTRSMVLQLPPRSMIEIFFGTSTLWPSAFLWSAPYQSSRSGATHPLSNQRLLSASGLRPSGFSNLNFHLPSKFADFCRVST